MVIIYSSKCIFLEWDSFDKKGDRDLFKIRISVMLIIDSFFKVRFVFVFLLRLVLCTKIKLMMTMKMQQQKMLTRFGAKCLCIKITIQVNKWFLNELKEISFSSH